MIALNGAAGEGGGQILRTALTLSIITGRPFRITNVRANRAKPGLMRQHLVAVRAAAQICAAVVSDAAAGSTVLEFSPGVVKAGDTSHVRRAGRAGAGQCAPDHARIRACDGSVCRFRRENAALGRGGQA